MTPWLTKYLLKQKCVYYIQETIIAYVQHQGGLLNIKVKI